MTPQPADTYAAALAFTLRWEGGFADVAGDRGGATMRGVTQRVYDAYRHSVGKGTRPVRQIDGAELHAIYRERYWIAARCHLIPDRSLAIAHFDFAVNSGVRRAVTFLQKLVGVADDGRYGPATIEAVARALARDPRLVDRYIDDREDFLRRIARGNQVKFLSGWLNRINDLRKYIA